jgi:hypothetical protein
MSVMFTYLLIFSGSIICDRMCTGFAIAQGGYRRSTLIQ